MRCGGDRLDGADLLRGEVELGCLIVVESGVRVVACPAPASGVKSRRMAAVCGRILYASTAPPRNSGTPAPTKVSAYFWS
jgi:hypothetical protein